MTKWGLFGLIALPVLEITLFVVVGGAIGILATLGVIFGTFFLGVALLRTQSRPRPQPNTRAEAVAFVGHQVVLFLAAICLILPGFFTDLIGLLLLIRPLRSLVIGLVSVSVLAKFGDFAQRGGMAPADDVLEGDFIDVTPKSPRAYRSVENQDH